ncbi:MAG: tetratricopeptide repeat protein [Thermodesulfobacteriota bacterium]
MTPSLELGERLFAEGRIEEARACFTALAAGDPGNASAWNDLGVACLALGDEPAAEEAFLKAVEPAGGFTEARINLADFYLDRGRFEEATAHLETCLRSSPGHLGLTEKLARAYAESGRREDSKRLLGRSPAVRIMERLMDSLWSGLYYWELTEGPSLRERLEGAVAGALAILDGEGGGPRFKLVAEHDETGEPVVLEGLHRLFYYKNQESAAVRRRRAGELEALTPDHLEDWTFFIEMLYRDIHAEGMCLGDFSHSRRVFAGQPRLSRYDRETTFQFFRENLGPCDCHVFRWSEMGVTAVKVKVDREEAECPWRPRDSRPADSVST